MLCFDISLHVSLFFTSFRYWQAKGVSLPTETNLQYKAIATAWQALSGNTFDEQYVLRVGDHQRTLDLLQETQKQTKDEERKAYAAKIGKAIGTHPEHAKKLKQKK